MVRMSDFRSSGTWDVLCHVLMGGDEWEGEEKEWWRGECVYQKVSYESVNNKAHRRQYWCISLCVFTWLTLISMDSSSAVYVTLAHLTLFIQTILLSLVMAIKRELRLYRYMVLKGEQGQTTIPQKNWSGFVAAVLQSWYLFFPPEYKPSLTTSESGGSQQAHPTYWAAIFCYWLKVAQEEGLS